SQLQVPDRQLELPGTVIHDGVKPPDRDDPDCVLYAHEGVIQFGTTLRVENLAVVQMEGGSAVRLIHGHNDVPDIDEAVVDDNESVHDCMLLSWRALACPPIP